MLECAANLACAGAEPLGLTNCLNFGNPEKPHVAWQLSEAVRGLADACRALEVPVVGGNVSLYNEAPEGPDLPDAGRGHGRPAARSRAQPPRSASRARATRSASAASTTVSCPAASWPSCAASPCPTACPAPTWPRSALPTRPCEKRSARASCPAATTWRREASWWPWPRRASRARSAPRSPARTRTCSGGCSARRRAAASSSRASREAIDRLGERTPMTVFGTVGGEALEVTGPAGFSVALDELREAHGEPRRRVRIAGPVGTLEEPSGSGLLDEQTSRPSRRTARRVRSLRRLRAGVRRRAPGLLRALRASAPRPGVRRHRHLRGRPHHDPARPRPRLAGVRRAVAPRAPGRDGDRARPLLDHGLLGVGERPAGLPLRPPAGRAGAQRQPHQRRRAALGARGPRRAVPLHLRLGDHRRAALHARVRLDRRRARRRDSAASRAPSRPW